MARDYWWTGERIAQMNNGHLRNSIALLKREPDAMLKLLQAELFKREQFYTTKEMLDTAREAAETSISREEFIKTRTAIYQTLESQSIGFASGINNLMDLCTRIEARLAAAEARINNHDRPPAKTRRKIRK